MARSDYLVQAGIGFDIDRASSKKAVGIFEGIAEMLNTSVTKKSKEAFDQTQRDYESTIKDIEKTNDAADAALMKSSQKSIKAVREGLQGAMLKPPEKASEAAKEAAGGAEAYAKKYDAQLG